MGKKKIQKSDFSKSESYSQAVGRLSDYLKISEEKRRSWAGEYWLHENGRLSCVHRFLTPLLTLFGVILAFCYSGIRLVSTITTLTMTDAECNKCTLYAFLVLALALALLICGVLTVINKKKIPGIISAVCDLAVAIHIFTQMNAIPIDNTTHGAAFNYKQLCIFTVIWFLILFLMNLCYILIVYADKRAHKKLLEATLSGIISQKKGITNDDEYCELIDCYLANKAQKDKPSLETDNLYD